MDNGNPEQWVLDYVQYCKLATAVAIIHGSPPEQSGEQFAKHLCGQFQLRQLQIQQQLQQLEEELLQLKQQLCQNEVVGANNSEDDIFPTPPYSQTALPNEDVIDDIFQYVGKDVTAVMQNNTDFLRSILAIKSASRFQKQILHSPELENTILSTLKHSLCTIKQSLTVTTKDHPLSAAIVLDSLETIVNLSQNYGTVKHVAMKSVFIDLESLMKDILHLILHIEETDMNDFQHHLCQYLLILAKSPSLLSCLLSNIVYILQGYSQTLRAVSMGTETLDSHLFENIGHIFWLLENIIIKYGKNCLEMDVVAHMKGELEDTLLFISSDYPLYAYYVWHVGSLVGKVSLTTK